MNIGLIPPYSAGPVETGAFAHGLARLAEELGFESIWAAEHVVVPAQYESRYPYSPNGRMPIEEAAIPDPLTWLTWAAAATTRLLVGTYVVILPQHNPLVLAKRAASLDRLCQGRLRLGVGIGWLREEAEALGTSWTDRGTRASEAIEVMRALWREPLASHRGRDFDFQNVRCRPQPARAEGVPILVGGHSQAAARRAGRLGDGFIPLGGGPAELAQLRKVMEGAAREAGRDPATIEITRSGPADADTIRAYADAGVDRMLVPCLAGDLESARRQLGRLSEEVIARS